MEKIMTLDTDTYNRIAKDGELGKLKEILGIKKNEKYQIGDTMVKIDKISSAGDVFKYERNGRKIFYVVINPLNESMAFCYSIYPVFA